MEDKSSEFLVVTISSSLLSLPIGVRVKPSLLLLGACAAAEEAGAEEAVFAWKVDLMVGASALKPAAITAMLIVSVRSSR